MTAREIRAPRGSELSCRSWPQEAAMRMLMNNLDPEVAERPQDLVVYGGTGRAARSWEAFDAIVRSLRTLGDDETLLVQSGKPVAVFRTHDLAPRVLISNSMLVPKWADWETFRELEAQGLTMYGQMTAGLVDLHRHPGDPAGHVRDARRVRRPALRRLARRHGHAHRRARRHGRCPAARRHDERRRRALRRGRPRADRAPHEDALPRPRDRRARRGAALGRRGEGAGARRSRSGWSATAARCCRALLRRGWHARCRHRSDQRARPARRLRAGRLSLAEAVELRERDPDGYVATAPKRRWPPTSRRSSGFAARGAVAFDYGNNLRAGAEAGGLAARPRVQLPGVRAGVRATAVLRGQGAVPVGGAVGRPRRHRGDRSRRGRAVPRRRAPAPVAAPGGRTGRVPGAAGSDLLARLRRARSSGGLRFNELVASGRGAGADRDRA